MGLGTVVQAPLRSKHHFSVADLGHLRVARGSSHKEFGIEVFLELATVRTGRRRALGLVPGRADSRRVLAQDGANRGPLLAICGDACTGPYVRVALSFGWALGQISAQAKTRSK